MTWTEDVVDPRVEAVLEQRARELAGRVRSRDAVAPRPILLVFDAGGSAFGLPIADTERVEAAGRLAAAPGGGAGFAGLASVGGKVRPVLDAPALLGLNETIARGGYLIVPRGDWGVALRVGERPIAAEADPMPEDPRLAVLCEGDVRAGAIVTLITVAELRRAASAQGA